MPEGSGGDLFDPRRLRKLWEQPEEDAFEKREREEKELQESEPVLVALDLYEQIVRTCRRTLGGRVRPLEPLLKHTRGLLAMKLAAERGEAQAAAAPAAPAPEPGKKPPAGPPGALGLGPRGRMGNLVDNTLANTVSDQRLAAERVKHQLGRAMALAGVDKKTAAAPVAQPAELGAALDAIEDLYELLGYGASAAAAGGAGYGDAVTGRAKGMLQSKFGTTAEMVTDQAQMAAEGEFSGEMGGELGLAGMGEG